MIAARARRPRFPLPLALALALAVPVACASAGQPMCQAAAEINATLDPHPERFAPGDTLLVRFAHDSNLDQAVRVDQAGRASFLLVGSFSVAGKTPDQFEEELRQAYSTKLATPDLSVIPSLPEVDALEPTTTGRVFHVLGEVKKPGAFPLVGQRVTLVQAIAFAGSFDKTSALLKRVMLARWMPEESRWRSWKLDAREEHWGAPEQIYLQAADIVYVPNTPIDEANIWVDKYIRQMIPFPYLFPPISY